MTVSILFQVAKHLSHCYGTKAIQVAKEASLTGNRWPVIGKRLNSEFPYIEAEVRFAIQEYACTVVDVLARRTRLAFLNVHAAQEALPRVVDVMAEELNWSKARKEVGNWFIENYQRKEQLTMAFMEHAWWRGVQSKYWALGKNVPQVDSRGKCR